MQGSSNIGSSRPRGLVALDDIETTRFEQYPHGYVMTGVDMTDFKHKYAPVLVNAPRCRVYLGHSRGSKSGFHDVNGSSSQALCPRPNAPEERIYKVCLHAPERHMAAMRHLAKPRGSWTGDCFFLLLSIYKHNAGCANVILWIFYRKWGIIIGVCIQYPVWGGVAGGLSLPSPYSHSSRGSQQA